MFPPLLSGQLLLIFGVICGRGKIGHRVRRPQPSQLVEKEIEMRTSKRVLTLLLSLGLVVIVGCGTGSSSSLGSQTQSASIFTMATDASLPRDRKSTRLNSSHL